MDACRIMYLRKRYIVRRSPY